MHSGPFGCLTKLGAKRAELVPKFVPGCRVGIFRNEHTRSIPLDPKLTFWCVSYYLSAFGTVWLHYETRCQAGRTSAKVRATKSLRNFRNERIRSTPLDPKLTFWYVSYYLGVLGPFGCLSKLVQNGPNLCQSSCHEVASDFFASNAPYPPHWTLN